MTSFLQTDGKASPVVFPDGEIVPPACVVVTVKWTRLRMGT